MWDCGSVETEKFNLIFFFSSFHQPLLYQKLENNLAMLSVTLQLQYLLLLLQALN